MEAPPLGTSGHDFSGEPPFQVPDLLSGLTQYADCIDVLRIVWLVLQNEEFADPTTRDDRLSPRSIRVVEGFPRDLGEEVLHGRGSISPGG
jgi:hypothetical protein